MKIDTATARILAERFPRFGKIQKCMINNPEYGVGLSEAAIAYLDERINGTRAKPDKPPPRKPVRKKQNRVAVRLNDEDYELMQAAMEHSGSKTVQEFLEAIIRSNLTKGDANAC